MRLTCLPALVAFGTLLSSPAQAQEQPALPRDDTLAVSIVPEDLNADGTVDAADLATFTADWQAFKAGGALQARSDFSGDGKLDTVDAALILKWRLFCEQYGSYRKSEARKTVGPAGGAVAVNGLTLTVPAGAFASEAALIVYRVPGLPGLNEDCATGTFRVEGLPTRTAKPLKVTLALAAGQTTSGLTSLVLSERVWSTTAGGATDSYQPLDATVSGGKIAGYIPATEESATDAPAQGEEPQTVVFSVLTGQRALTSANNRFRVIFDRRSCTATQAAIIADYAERAYYEIEAETGWGLSWARRTRYPIDITIRALQGGADENMAEAVSSIWGVNRICINGDSGWCDTTERTRELAIAVEHEVLHVAQYLYDPRTSYSVASRAGPWLWMDEATATLFEYHRGVDRVPKPAILPIPSTVEQNYDFLIRHGLEYPPGQAKPVQRHGYGASMFLEYLNRTNPTAVNPNRLGDMYEAYYANSSLRPCEALASLLGGNTNLGAAFTGFSQAWTQGAVYRPPTRPPFPDAGKVLTAAGAVERFRTDCRVEFTNNVDDLSMWPVLLYRPRDLPCACPPLAVAVAADLTYLDRALYFYRNKALQRWNANPAVEYGIDDFDSRGQALLCTVINSSALYPYTGSRFCGVRARFDPYITGLTPTSGAPGAPFTIDGWGFGADPSGGWEQGGSYVSLGIFPGCPIASWSNTRVQTAVPTSFGGSGSAEYPATVTTRWPSYPGERVSNSMPFTVVYP
jgi:hypothetical protein